jgi:UDP-N-acetylmuramyl pentapeptide phosphotransferase/UDP-N-acetylglucosamine-1-phosphate transferase
MENIFAGMLVLVASFASSILVTRELIPLLRRQGVLDVPNRRSSHTIPTPRGGGLGILVGIGIGSITASLLGISLVRPEILFAAALIALTGLIDDRRGLSARSRLMLQLLAAVIVIARLGGLPNLPLPEPWNISLDFLSMPMALIWVVAVTNLFNFLDGIDGFAGLQGTVAGIGIAAYGLGDSNTGMGLAIAGACVGFLIHNWHPAKVFMGDVGSGTLGFLFAVLPFELPPIERGNGVLVTVICLWFFLSDGVFTLISRLFRGEKIWTAHRSHLYQRLVKAGLQHNQVTVRVIGSATLLIGLAVLLRWFNVLFANWVLLILSLVAFISYYYQTVRREKGLTHSRIPILSPSQLHQKTETKAN